MAVADVSRALLNRAIIARRLGQQEVAAAWMRQAFAYFYWAEEVDTCVRRTEGWQDEQGDDLLHQAIAWQCFSAQCRSAWFALWLAPHLHNQFAQPAERPSLYGYALDKAARRFMALLQRVLLTGQWPGSIDVSALGGHGPLLLALQEPQASSVPWWTIATGA
jgi:hypothetical protein